MHECGFNDDFVNVAAYLPLRGRNTPFKTAVSFPENRDRYGRTAWTHLTFKQLEVLSNKYANGFDKAGIKRGCKVLLMVRPSLDFVALTFSLFKIGAVPILIDPGMGLKNLLSCIRDVEPQAIVAVSEVLAAKKFLPYIFKKVETEIAVGPSPWWWKGLSTDSFIKSESSEYEIQRTRPDELAAILFTSGSTGPAKGVEYIHSIFEAQVRQLKDFYKITSDEIEMPAFPLFALFSPALGISCVIPDMDPTKPAQVNPERIVAAALDFGATNTFGSPAIWRRVATYCLENSIKLPSFKRLLLAGAPIPIDILKSFTEILSRDALACTPYGCTESLPTFNVTHHEILRPDRIEKNRSGKGVLVGRPISEMHAKIIRITDEAIENIDSIQECPAGEIGEIIVTGPVTTRAYHKNPRANKFSKIRDEKRVWHRVGDVGYIDEEGYYWFCGRKAHRLETPAGQMFTIPCEAIFNNHPNVFRSALVGPGKRGRQFPVMIVEPVDGAFPSTRDQIERFRQELLEIGKKNPLTNRIQIIMFHRSFPVDIRHNAKIFREKLTLWATRRVGFYGKIIKALRPVSF